MAEESFPAFLRSLERSIEPLERIAGVAPPFRDEDEVEETTASDLAFVLRDPVEQPPARAR